MDLGSPVFCLNLRLKSLTLLLVYTLLTLRAHAQEGYGSCFVSLSVCLSVTTLAAASFSSTIKLRYAGLHLSFSSFLTCRFSQKFFVQKLWCHFLTVTVSDGIAATPVSFFSDGGGF